MSPFDSASDVCSTLPEVPLTVPLCPASKVGRRRGGDYLCRGCWYTLPTPTRTALRAKDGKAPARLQELYRLIAADTPLRSIRIRK